jgi:type IV pilus assembly protein PilM
MKLRFWQERRWFPERRPQLACEFSSGQVAAAHRNESGTIDKLATRAWEPGTLVPDLSAANLAGRELVRQALQEALAAVNGARREVAVVVPDACCRLALLDVDVLPEKKEDAEALVRHRLKRALPFDVEKAAVQWQAQQANGKSYLLAAAALRTVMEEYESVVREAGYRPGLVLPATLAALRLVDAAQTTLLVTLEPETMSIVIVHQGAVVLVRVLNRIAEGPAARTKMTEAIYPSLTFFEDTYGGKVERVLIGGAGRGDELRAVVEELTGVRSQELTSTAPLLATDARAAAELGALCGSLA